MRVLVVTGEAYPGHELRNRELAVELAKQGFGVVHALPGEGLCAHGFSRSAFTKAVADKLAAPGVQVLLFQAWQELHKAILWSDVVVLGTSKALYGAAEYAKVRGRFVVQHRDIGGLDPWQLPSDILAVRSPWEIEALRARGVLLSYQAPIVGTTQFDAAAPQNLRMDKIAFCKKYGIDPDKKLIAFLPASPANHTAAFRDTYVRILNIISENPEYQAVIKPHPNDYANLKADHYYGSIEQPTWKQLAPDATVCLPEDKYELFHAADLLLARQSTIVFEAALFHKPIVFVDYPEIWLSRPDDGANDIKDALPGPRWSPPARREMTMLGVVDSRIDAMPDGPLRDFLHEVRSYLPLSRMWGIASEYIGTEIAMEESAWLLSDEARWRFDTRDVYEDYILRHCHANDGMAYKRVADLVASLTQEKAVIRRLRRLAWLRPFQRLSAPVQKAGQHARRRLASFAGRYRQGETR